MTAKTTTGSPNSKEKELGEMMKKYAALTLYLWVLFVLLGLYRKMLMKEWGVDAWQQGYALVNALVFAKVLLLGGIFHLGTSLRKYSFALVVIGRTLMFAALLMAFHVVEEAARALIKGEPVADSILHLGGGSWWGVWAYAALLFAMLLPLGVLGEISFVLGKGVLWKIMTSKEAKPSQG